VHLISQVQARASNRRKEQPWLTAPEIQSVLAAHFATTAWPAFSPSPGDGAVGAVGLNVFVRVSPDGKPLLAVLENGSIFPSYAKAVVDAAMASTYVVRKDSDDDIITKIFEVYYVLDVQVFSTQQLLV
jgi:hypothetical protein